MADGQTIAKAYVQIIPSTEGISGGIKDSLNGVSNEFETAGSKMGSLFAGALGGVLGSAISSIISTSISAAGKLLKDSIASSAEFEQLKGGAEAIFSNMDTTRILTDAKNAYKDLGLSVNDYLSKINDVGATFKSTMGDEKGYDTARRGLKAISDYSSLTGKDVETLSEKFTMITRATSSYQSIADQFAGLLPATSAEFLKQAQSAGDLSKRYKKLTEVPVAEYQAAVASALERGAEALNATGKTAEEAETTVSGSLQAMSKAWENWVTSLTSTDLDVNEMTQNLIDAFETAVDNLTPVIMKFGPAIAEALVVAFTKLGPVIVRLINQIIVEMLRAIPQMQNRVREAFYDLIAGAINTTLSSSVGRDLLKAIKEAFKMMLDGILTFYSGAFGNLIAKLFSVKSIKDKLNQIISELKEAGKNMVQGLIDGFIQKFNDLKDAPKNALKGMVKDIKDLLGIKSPSRVFKNEIGAMMARGLQIGWETEMSKVNGSIEEDVYATFDLASTDMISAINNRPSSSVSNSNSLAKEIAEVLSGMTIQNNVTLEGDVRTLFNVIQETNQIYKNSTGRSAFA